MCQVECFDWILVFASVGENRLLIDAGEALLTIDFIDYPELCPAVIIELGERLSYVVATVRSKQKPKDSE